jgi:cadmium resistance protein CadD (predicted permease)
MIHLLVGMVALCLGAWGIISWWNFFGECLRGFIPIMLVLLGLAAIGAGLRKLMGESEDEDEEEQSADTPVHQG